MDKPINVNIIGNVFFIAQASTPVRVCEYKKNPGYLWQPGQLFMIVAIFLTDLVGYKTPSTNTVALLLITSTNPP